MSNNELITQVFSIETEMKKLDLDVERKDEVLTLVENLDLIKNPQKVLELGANNRDSLADLSKQMLSLVTNDQLGVMGELMTDITVKLKRTDFSIGSEKSNIPLIGGLLAKFGNSKDRLITKFKTVESQLNDNLLQVEEAQKGLQLNNDSLAKLFEHTISVYTQLGLAVIAGRYKKNEIIGLIESLKSEGTDLAKQRENAYSHILERLDKRITDLELLRLSALQTLPQISFLQNNNIALIEKFQTISGLTIPAWQRQLMLALNILDQKKYSQLGEEIDNFTNETLLESAKEFKETSIHIAKQSNRQVIDIETLQKVQLDTLTAFEEVMAINKTSAQKRRETELQAQKLNDQLKSLVVADPQQLKISAE